MNKYIIRMHTEQDIPKISSLVERCVRKSCKESYSEAELNYWVSLYSEEKFSKYTQGWNLWVLSEKNTGEILGCVGLNHNEIKGLFVDPKHQGKKLGKKLLDFAERYALDTGITRLILDASPNAVPFYEKHKYVPLEKKTYVTPLQSGCLEVIPMFKEIPVS